MTADLTPAQAARLEEDGIGRIADNLVRAVRDWHANGATQHGLAGLGQLFRQALAVAAVDVMRGATDDGAIGRDHHCSTCECIHEPCGYVIGSAGCEDFHDRADALDPR